MNSVINFILVLILSFGSVIGFSQEKSKGGGKVKGAIKTGAKGTVKIAKYVGKETKKAAKQVGNELK